MKLENQREEGEGRVSSSLFLPFPPSSLCLPSPPSPPLPPLFLLSVISTPFSLLPFIDLYI